MRDLLENGVGEGEKPRVKGKCLIPTLFGFYREYGGLSLWMRDLHHIQAVGIGIPKGSVDKKEPNRLDDKLDDLLVNCQGPEDILRVGLRAWSAQNVSPLCPSGIPPKDGFREANICPRRWCSCSTSCHNS